MKFRNAVIVDGMRSPFANYRKGKFTATRMDDVGAKVVRALLDRNPKVKDTMIEDFGIGMGGGAPEASAPNNVARLAGLPHEVTNFLHQPRLRFKHGNCPSHCHGHHDR